MNMTVIAVVGLICLTWIITFGMATSNRKDKDE